MSTNSTGKGSLLWGYVRWETEPISPVNNDTCMTYPLHLSRVWGMFCQLKNFPVYFQFATKITGYNEYGKRYGEMANRNCPLTASNAKNVKTSK